MKKNKNVFQECLTSLTSCGGVALCAVSMLSLSTLSADLTENNPKLCIFFSFISFHPLY